MIGSFLVGSEMVKPCSPTSEVIKATTIMDCVDKVEPDYYDGAVIPDTLMRCVSMACQARGINVDDEYVISYGECTKIINKKKISSETAFFKSHFKSISF